VARIMLFLFREQPIRLSRKKLSGFTYHLRGDFTMFNKKLAALAVAGATLLPAASASAVVQLGFILDESGSIGSSNYTIIQNGLASAMSLIPTTGQYEVSVVSFSSGASTIVNHQLISSAADAAAVAALILGDTFNGGSTDMAAAFTQMTTVLGGSTNSITSSYVNLATDGVANSQSAVTTAFLAMIAAGVDNVSIEAIGGGVDATYLQGTICYPQACDLTSPYNFPTQGFYIPVADANGYAAAIGNKVRVVTGQVPEPGSLALAGLALAGLAGMRRRTRQA